MSTAKPLQVLTVQLYSTCMPRQTSLKSGVEFCPSCWMPENLLRIRQDQKLQIMRSFALRLLLLLLTDQVDSAPSVDMYQGKAPSGIVPRLKPRARRSLLRRSTTAPRARCRSFCSYSLGVFLATTLTICGSCLTPGSRTTLAPPRDLRRPRRDLCVFAQAPPYPNLSLSPSVPTVYPRRALDHGSSGKQIGSSVATPHDPALVPRPVRVDRRFHARGAI